MPADTVEVVVKLSGLNAVQAGMRRLREVVSEPLTQMVSKARNLVLGLGSGLLAALSLRRLAAELNKASNEMDRAGKAGERLGVATDYLSGLEYAAGLAGSTTEKLHNSLKFLAQSIQRESDAFTTLGIDVRTADGHFRSQMEIMDEVADRFHSMPDGIQKTSLAMKIFGEEGLSMIPMLNAGAEGIQRLNKEARSFGLIVSPQAAAGAAAFNDNVSRLQLAFQGLARTALADLLPALVQLTNQLIEWIRQNDAIQKGAEALSEALRYLLFDIQAIVIFGRFAWRSVMSYLRDTWEAFKAFSRLLVRVWQQPVEVLKLLIDHLKVAVASVGDLSEALFLVATGKFGQAKSKVKEAGTEIAESLKNTGKGLLETFSETGKAVGDVIFANLDLVGNRFTTFAQESKTALQELWDAYVAIWKPKPLPPLPEGNKGPVDPLASISDQRKLIAEQLREAEFQLRRRRQEIADQIARLDNDFSKREADKHQLRIGLLKQEIGLLDEEIRKLEERLALEKDDQTRQSLTQSIRGLEDDRHSVQGQVNQLQGAPDPFSYRQQFVAMITEMEDRLGTFAQSIASHFSNVIGSAIDGIAQGIEGLIRGTMDWADALRHIGSSILNGVISAISRMFAEWIVKRALMAAKNMAFSQAEGAVDATAKAPGALMTSISSFGTAAILGTAALIAAVAAISGAFAEGGIVRGPGGPKDDSILARLSNGEGVLNAEAVRFYGEGLVHAMNQRTARFYASDQSAGSVPTSRPSGTQETPSTQPSKGSSVSLVLVDDRKQAKQFIASSEGESMIMDIVRRRRLEVGIPG